MGVLDPDRVRRGVRSPKLFLRELNRWYHRRLYRRDYNPAGIDIFAADWDNLVVLDACRYDLFEARHDLAGELQARRSRGSNTVEWLQANVQGRELLDTVYVTANPQLHRHRDELDVTFHAEVHVWQEIGWDEKHRTVLPETVTQYARDAAAAYPDKRLIVHYIQPHYPFLTERAHPFRDSQAFLRPDEPGSWQQVMTGNLTADRAEVWQAYSETLDRALPAVETLLDALNGRSVVTADHGNMVGDRARPIPVREWGHPGGIYTDELVRVPWLVVEGERRPIRAEPPADEATQGGDATDVAETVVERRLEDLGYR